jgi:hypothetical protein
MRELTNRRTRMPIVLAGGLLLAALASPAPALAGKLSWMDEFVQEVVRGAKAEGKTAARAEDVAARGAGRLFVHEADDGLEALAKRSDDLARAARRAEAPAEALLETRFARLARAEPEAARTFRSLAPAERRLVVEMGETAQRLARRHPGQAETLIRRLGVEGMTAVRVYGDDVAEVVAKEGPESINVLRKAGRGGWKFFTETVLPHKKKLAAAGVLALFLANPDRFVDSAGRITEYAVDQFARAGIQLAGAVGGGATRGLETALGRTLATYGIDSVLARRVGMGAAVLAIVLATLVLLGLPIGLVLRPLSWPLRLVRGRRAAPGGVKAA